MLSQSRCGDRPVHDGRDCVVLSSWEERATEPSPDRAKAEPSPDLAVCPAVQNVRLSHGRHPSRLATLAGQGPAGRGPSVLGASAPTEPQ